MYFLFLRHYSILYILTRSLLKYILLKDWFIQLDFLLILVFCPFPVKKATINFVAFSQNSYCSVKITGPSLVITRVCSYCADN